MLIDFVVLLRISAAWLNVFVVVQPYGILPVDPRIEGEKHSIDLTFSNFHFPSYLSTFSNLK
jgi:hypothetical protein